jgi:hypothetical protein
MGGVFNLVEGATQAALNLKTLAVMDNGAQFRVDVSNEYALVSSNVVTLSVAPLGALRVTADPVLSGGMLGALRSGQDGLVLSATAEDAGGAQTATYQWRRDGVVVFTGTTMVVAGKFQLPYRLPKVSNDTDGVYDVVVDNGAAFAVSKGLALRLDPRIEQVDIPATANHGCSPVWIPLPTRDGQPRFGAGHRDVTRHDRTVKAAAFARLADDDHGKPGHTFGHTFRFTAALDIVRFKLNAVAIEALKVCLAGADRLAGGQQEIARIARAHLHAFTHLAKLVHALHQDQVNHVLPPGSSLRRPHCSKMPKAVTAIAAGTLKITSPA